MKRSQYSTKLGVISILAAAFLSVSASASDSIPSPKKTVAPQLRGALEDITGEVHVVVDIDKYGFVTDAEIQSSSHAALNKTTLDAVHQWTFKPAIEDGVAVSSKALQPFYFNHGSIVLESKSAPEDKLPTVRKSVKPELSDELKNITGVVVLQANLSESGSVESVRIESSTHSELEAPAEIALENWSFKPAVKDGQAVASRILIPFRFHGNGKATEIAASAPKALDKAPVALRRYTPELPREIREERGEAKLELLVDEHGYVADVAVLESSSAPLSEAAREAAWQWKFKPAIKDGVPVSSRVLQPFSFNGGLITADLPVDSMPKVKFSKTPKVPEALAKVQGFVQVRLNVDERGKVLSASCTKSSHDELVAPTLDAAKSWTFAPAVREGEKVPSTVLVPFVFNERS